MLLAPFGKRFCGLSLTARNRSFSGVLTVGSVLLLGSAFHLQAEEGGLAAQIAAGNSLLSLRQDAEGGADGGSTRNSYWADHFQIHGFVTTAYQEEDPDDTAPFRSSDAIVLGLDEDGTFNYRIAALQLRYDPNPKNTFVVQASHRRLGDSPVKDTEDEVELDWAFYQYHFTDNTSLKVGRVPVPLGIFNEYRDVGTLLPFFRPSFNFYREGSFVSETVDGGVFHHRFGADGEWSLDLDAYFGEWDLLESGATNDAALTEAEVTSGYGLQLWLNTPVPGLRFGVGGQSYDVSEESGFNLEEATWDTWYLSVDGAFEKFVVRAEYKFLEFPVDNDVAPGGEAETVNYYVQLGWLPIEKLGFYWQNEFGDVEQTSLIFAEPLDFKQREDQGISVVYSPLPNLVLKAEYHEQSFDLSTGVDLVSLPPNLQVRVLFEEFESEYAIFSLSFSF